MTCIDDFSCLSFVFYSKVLLNLFKHGIIQDSIANSNQLKFLIEISDEYLIIYDILWSLSFDFRIQEQLRLNQTFLDKLEKYSTDEHMKIVIRRNTIEYKSCLYTKES